MGYTRLLRVAFVIAIVPIRAVAQPEAPANEVKELRKEVEELRQAVRALQDALKQLQPSPTATVTGGTEEEKQLEAEIRAAMPPATLGAPTAPASEGTAASSGQQSSRGPGTGRGSSLLNPDISFNGDFTFFGTDNRQLNKANRFSFREAEVGFQAPIDPFARADAFVTFGEGESADIEEAYATFLTLPFNLQARGGKFRVSFGKNNLLHRHALPQTDRPFAAVANFGEEGFAGAGVGVSCLVPNAWDQYVLLTGEIVNDLGESPDEAQGTPLQERPPARVFRDFAYVSHVQSFFDLNTDSNIELGGSALVNLPKSGSQTKLYGLDLSYRWRPLGQAGYRQFLWRTEGYLTERELRDSDAAQLPPGTDTTFNTVGFYTFAEYHLTQRLWLGTRIDWTELPARRRQTEWGIYPYTTFSPTEFGYFRFGYQYAESDQLKDKQSHRVWLQYDFSIGSHAAHPF